MRINLGSRALVTLWVTLGLIGCSVKGIGSSVLLIDQPVHMNVQPGIFSNTAIEMDSETLQLGANQLSHWLASQPDCLLCDVSVRLHYRPDGPTTYVVARDDASIWTFVNSFRSRINIGDIQIIASSNAETLVSVGDIQKSIVLGQTVVLNNCDVTLLWAEALPPGSPLYSDDQPKFRLQVLSVCKN